MQKKYCSVGWFMFEFLHWHFQLFVNNVKMQITCFLEIAFGVTFLLIPTKVFHWLKDFNRVYELSIDMISDFFHHILALMVILIYASVMRWIVHWTFYQCNLQLYGQGTITSDDDRLMKEISFQFQMSSWLWFVN